MGGLNGTSAPCVGWPVGAAVVRGPRRHRRGGGGGRRQDRDPAVTTSRAGDASTSRTRAAPCWAPGRSAEPFLDQTCDGGHTREEHAATSARRLARRAGPARTGGRRPRPRVMLPPSSSSASSTMVRQRTASEARAAAGGVIDAGKPEPRPPGAAPSARRRPRGASGPRRGRASVSVVRSSAWRSRLRRPRTGPAAGGARRPGGRSTARRRPTGAAPARGRRPRGPPPHRRRRPRR